MFKYKVKCVGWEYHIYRKKHWFGLWQDTGIVFTHKGHAERYTQDMNHLEGVN